MNRQKETRTLHFDLSGSPAGAQHTMNIGGRRIPLTPHTTETRARHRNVTPLLSRVPDHRLTHHVPDTEFLADAIQSYYVTHPPAKGDQPNLAMAGIVVPKHVAARMQDKYGAQKGPFSAKVRAFGLAATADSGDPSWLNTQDLADLQDMTDAATFLVYHHPNLITLSAGTGDDGSDVAMQIITLIQACPGFDYLVSQLNQQGPAQNLTGWNEGYQGWANAETFTDPLNPATAAQWWYGYTDQTNAAALPVVQQAQTAVRNQQNLDGTSFMVDYGSHAAESTTTTATTEAVSGGKVALKMRATAMAAADAAGYTYSLTDPDFNHGRQVVVSSSSGRQITLTVNNSYFRHLGLFLRFLDPGNNPIALSTLPAPFSTSQSLNTTYDYFADYMSSRGRFLGIPTESETSDDITITIPDSAASLMILCGGMGVGSLPSGDSDYKGVQVPGAILTGVIDLGLPAFFLAFGATMDLVVSGEGKKLLLSLATWIVEVFAEEIAISAFDAGNASKSQLQTDWAEDILHSVIVEAPQEFAGLVAWAATESGVEDAFACVPIVGAILKALDIAGTLAELTETVADICLSPWVITDTLNLLMDVDVTLTPGNNYEFPAAATKMQISVTLDQAQPQIYSVTLADVYPSYPGKVATIVHSFQVPAGGTLTVTTNFVDDSGWVAASGTSGTIPAVLPEGQQSLAITIPLVQNPYPINNQTQYVHKNILTSDGNGNHTWVAGPAPTATVKDLGGNNAVTLNDLASISINSNGRLGYAWQGQSASLVQAGTTTGSTPLYTLQSINLNVAASIDADLRVLGNTSSQYGFTLPIYMEFDPTGPTSSTSSDMAMHFIVAPALDPTTGVTEYHAFQVNLDGTQPIDLLNAQSYGRFASPTLDAIAVHPRGFVLALNATNEKVEILTIPSQPYASISDAAYATQTGGEGSYIGLLHGSRAIAITKDGNTFFVLEGVNQRIQAFSVQGGTSVQYFGTQPWVPLLQQQDQGKIIQWCDMSVDPTGYIFVLSYDTAGPTYRLDVYEPDGTFLTRTTGVNAARLTVDPFRAVYTANYALLSPLIRQRPEPSVSLWVGSQPS